MNRENQFNYKGFDVVFCGFYLNRFVFYCSSGRCVFVSSIRELEDELDKLIK